MTILQTLTSVIMKPVNKVLAVASTIIGICNWTLTNPVTQDELDKVNSLLASNYYIILTRNNNHLSSYMIGISDFFLSGKFGFWGHTLINVEDQVVNETDFKFVESIASGVQYATFKEVTAVNSIALLKPKTMPADDWNAILQKAYADIGKPYDLVFDLNQTDAMSCVELVRNVLQADPTYATNFANFEALAQKHGKVTPQMLYDCGDFEVVYEVRH